MNPKIYKIFSTFYIFLALPLVLYLLGGCDNNRNNRRFTPQILGPQGAPVTAPKYRTVYALSMVSGAPSVNTLNRLQTNGTTSPNRFQRNAMGTRVDSSGNPLPPIPTTTTPGSYGLLSVITVEDSKGLNGDTMSSFQQISLAFQNDSTGVAGYRTNIEIPIGGVRKDSFIDVLPDGKSLLVTQPNSKSIAQYYLNEDNGVILGLPTTIQLQGIPTRFVAMHNFTGDNKKILVATNKGVEVVIFDTPSPYPNIPKGRPYGAIQNAGDARIFQDPLMTPSVFDIAISPDDQLVYISTAYSQFMYKEMKFMDQQRPFAAVQSLAYQPLKLATPPKCIETYPCDSIAALTQDGLHFVNLATDQLPLKWPLLGPLTLTDIEFHPDGTSILVLTASGQLFRASLLKPEMGFDLQNITIPTGAREMAIDKKLGDFLAIGASKVVSMHRLDPDGIVSPNGASDRVPIQGDAISVAIK